jgi:hypothetical protein
MPILARIINTIHLLVVLAVVFMPFTNSNYLLFLHSIFVPFMILHWVMNNNTCVLTVTEKYIRGVQLDDEKDCYTCQLINPVFDVTKNYNKFSNLIYILTIGLWSISSYKLYNKIQSGSIKSIRDLYII